MKLCSGIAGVLLAALTNVAGADKTVSFDRDIRPILAKNCFACHGPDEGARKAELRLDTAEGATAELDGRRALVPGQPGKSELVRRVESVDPDVVMPPPDSGHELSDADRKLLRNWIAEGGEYKVHWSFTRPMKGEVPPVKQVDWPKHAIDRFVLARLESEKLTPSTRPPWTSTTPSRSVEHGPAGWGLRWVPTRLATTRSSMRDTSWESTLPTRPTI
jgi:mono/diheme cytochrome c family protein